MKFLTLLVVGLSITFLFSPIPEGSAEPSHGFTSLSGQTSTSATTSATGEEAASNRSMPDITGTWEGTLEFGGAKLRIVFHIKKISEDSLTATMDSPDQSAMGIKTSAVRYDWKNLTIEVASIMGTFEGEIKSNNSIEGVWKQSGFELELNLKRTDRESTINRPQEPERPFPYREEEVVIENKEQEITLAGTLTIPAGNPPFPAVILISGSGPEDRDETVFGHRPFLVLSDYLTRRGIAVLRVDDRGVGGSSGSVWESTSEDLATDVIAEFNYLRTRKEIHPDKIGLIGHSEGGLIAPMVAGKVKDVAFIVLLAGPGIRGDRLILKQIELIGRAEGLSPEKVKENLALQKSIFKILLEDGDREEAKRKVAEILGRSYSKLSDMEKSSAPDSSTLIDQNLKKLFNPWFLYFISYDPAPALRNVKCPVLALIGEKDLQVPAEENLKAIEEALAEGGNSDFTVKKVEGVNHLFQRAETGAVSEYSKIQETISPDVLKLVASWILEHTKN